MEQVLSDDAQDKADLVLKLLARAEDEAATENERKIAKKKAENLMDKHSLSREQLVEADYVLEEWHLPEYTQAPNWYRTVMVGLKDMLGVFSLYYSGSRFRGDKNARLRITGRESDVQMYKYLLVSIKNQIHELCDGWKAEYKKRHGETPSRRDTYAFRSSCASRVKQRLREIVDSVTESQIENDGADENAEALTLKEEAERKQTRSKEIMRENGYSWTSGSGSTWKRGAGSRAGRRAGNKVNVRKPASSSGQKKLAT